MHNSTLDLPLLNKMTTSLIQKTPFSSSENVPGSVPLQWNLIYPNTLVVHKSEKTTSLKLCVNDLKENLSDIFCHVLVIITLS